MNLIFVTFELGFSPPLQKYNRFLMCEYFMAKHISRCVTKLTNCNITGLT